MKRLTHAKMIFLLFSILGCSTSTNPNLPKADLQFDFENNVKSENQEFAGNGFSFVKGMYGQALKLNADSGYKSLSLKNMVLDGSKDFSIQCWINTTSANPTVFLSQKDFENKGISAQQNAGWALFSSGGTFGWSIGSGKRRINYERDNGTYLPINDGQWHQLTITFSKELAEFRLYYDGQNTAVYNVGFDFANDKPLVIGSVENDFDYETNYVPDIMSGADALQAFVDEFNKLGIGRLKPEEFISLIVDPKKVYQEKKGISSIPKDSDQLNKVYEARRKLYHNPYTVYQNRGLTELKPVSKIYSLKDDKVVINKSAAKSFTLDEKLYPSDFAMDKLSIWDQSLNAQEVLASFEQVRKNKQPKAPKKVEKLTVGVWNIWHGGIHWTTEKDGWDSRLRIVEILKENNVDVVLMQETYSSGDFIAAELGYYFATTSDWDYCYQGSNISVLSRFPITELFVNKETEFNNVGAKLAVSKTQEIYAMSNWYGWDQFPDVFDFHASRFDESDTIPVMFGGDFNAVPHTDGGKSPASPKMLSDGFTDAFRSLYPDVKKYPGNTHRMGDRIDQLYYKGKGLKNTLTKVVSSWPTGFPSDHYLIVSEFELNY